MGLLEPHGRHRRRHGQADLSAPAAPPLEPPLRLATEADAPVLARLIEAASHGLASYTWAGLATPGQDPWAIGEARQAERARAGAYIVADEGEGAVACLLAADPSPPDADLAAYPPVFRPLVALERLAPDCLYVNVLATLPEARRRGHATRLMRHAEAMARARGRRGLSLIVADVNTEARRLYDRLGFREQAARPMVKDGWPGAGETWRLMVLAFD